MKQPSTIRLALLFGLFVLLGVGDALYPKQLEDLQLVSTVLIAVLLFSWVKAHAQEHQIKEPPGAAMLAGVVAPIGIPYYFFRGFGFRRGLAGILRALLFLFLASLAYAAVRYFTEWVQA